MHEERGRYLWLVVVMAILGIGVPGFVRSAAPTSTEPPAAAEQESESPPVPGAGPAAESTNPTRGDGAQLSPSFFHPLQAMLACEQLPLDEDLGSWVEHCRLGDTARQRDAIVAIVPDPLDSLDKHTFDRLLEAIDRAARQAGYVRDRYYLPWHTDVTARRRDSGIGPPPATPEHETTPGLLLFRRDCRGRPVVGAPCIPGLLAVLLVGETAAWGVHHGALDRALVMADTLETDARARPLRILGPTFSGSVSSLRDALEHYPYPCAMRHTRFEVVTGEANPDNKDVMEAPWPRDRLCWPAWFVPRPSFAYHATVTDDDETTRQFYLWLARTMDMPLKPKPGPPCTLAGVGILTDTDPMNASKLFSFARSAGGNASGGRATSPAECTGTGPAPRLEPEFVLRYPSRVGHLRNTYERTRRHKVPATQLPIEDPRSMLDLSLADSDEVVEAVPAFSDTQFADELVFTGSLKAMCRSDLRFLGILGADVVNRLFLAREVRRYCPNVRLFMLEGDVLYAHPDVADAMNGSLIVSPYPLFPQNGASTRAGARGVIASLGDSTAQGTYNALLRLIAPAQLRVPRTDNALPVWVSAAGNGTLWPVEVLDGGGAPNEPGLPAADAARRTQRDAETALHMFASSGQWKWAFGMIWLAGTLLAAGYWLGRYAPRWHIVGLDAFRVFRPVGGAAAEHAVFSLLALVPVTCAYMVAAGFALLVHLPRVSAPLRTVAGTLRDGLSGVPAAATGLLLVAACADAVIAPLAAAVAAKRRGGVRTTRWLHAAGLLAAGIALVALVAFLASTRAFDWYTWLTLRERAINTSSGLSPLLPTAGFAAAVFIAARMQLARIHHRAAEPVADPMAACDHPAVAGMPALGDGMLTVVDRFSGGFWPGTVLLVVTSAAWWLGGIPSAMTMLEGPVWNWSLTLAALAGLALALASYIPFVLGCRRLRDYLRRHANLPCVDAFSRMSGRAAQKMSAILVKPPLPAEMQRTLQQLRLLSSQVRATRLQIDEDLRAELSCALSAAPAIEDALRRELDPAADPVGGDEPALTAPQLIHAVAVTLARVVASQWQRPASRGELAATSAGLRKLADHERDMSTAELYQRAADDETRVWLRLAEDFVATQSTTFFHEVLHTLRRLLTTATATALLLLAGVSSYPFERRPMLLSMMQGVVVVMVIGTVALLSSVEKSEVLGRIRKIEGAGKVTWNRSFIVRIAIYGILPIASVVATQLPSVAGALFGWLPALLGVMQ